MTTTKVCGECSEEKPADQFRYRICKKCDSRKAAAWNRAHPERCKANIERVKEAYKLARLRTDMTGFEWHVDHIIPLNGKSVCGLHVETNLRVIPGSVNRAKGNKVDY